MNVLFHEVFDADMLCNLPVRREIVAGRSADNLNRGFVFLD